MLPPSDAHSRDRPVLRAPGRGQGLREQLVKMTGAYRFLGAYHVASSGQQASATSLKVPHLTCRHPYNHSPSHCHCLGISPRPEGKPQEQSPHLHYYLLPTHKFL